MTAEATVRDDDMRERARGLHQRHINLRLRASRWFCM